jgi:hypothetical protein
MNNTEELAKDLAKNWTQNYTLSGRLAFMENQSEKLSILDKAESLGIRDEVMSLANAIMRGEA